ncbi:hypothetical protein SAY87_019571 [Trapa incisa]|uniref:Phosphatidylinositol-glycan biosynthesis class X protein n=1 Tax=Trapa incisa TaxID=236973 RepID=A0AAN7Q7I8_9MYRT|nr:hypothetical protein SAY87_019571 [Trapa incisa]
MGTMQGIMARDYCKYVTLWIIFICTVFFMPGTSSSGELEEHILDLHAGDSNMGLAHCPTNWIMQSYFEDPKALDDSHFQDFKKRKVYPCLCKETVSRTLKLELSGLGRRLIGEGSHRQLSSSIKIKLNKKSRVNLLSYSCKVIVIEILPRGIFADQFELQHLFERGAFGDIAVFGDTDLELPTVRSNNTVVEIHMDVDPTSLSGDEDVLEINLHIPLHVRYPPLDESGYVTAVFGEPDILVGFSFSIGGLRPDQSCMSILRDRDSAEPRHSPVTWAVPSGIQMHASIVSVVTFLSAAFSAVVIILATIFYSGNMSSKSSKQS